MPPSTWLRGGAPFPADGVRLNTTYKSGSGTSSIWNLALDPLLEPILGAPIQRGSLNLWADSPVTFPSPARVVLFDIEWLFAPIVIAEAEVGVAARRAETGDIEFIEVFASKHLASTLSLKIGDRVNICIHDGDHLGLAA